jgi:hypothetical protein
MGKTAELTAGLVTVDTTQHGTHVGLEDHYRLLATNKVVKVSQS